MALKWKILKVWCISLNFAHYKLQTFILMNFLNWVNQISSKMRHFEAKNTVSKTKSSCALESCCSRLVMNFFTFLRCCCLVILVAIRKKRTTIANFEIGKFTKFWKIYQKIHGKISKKFSRVKTLFVSQTMLKGLYNIFPSLILLLLKYKYQQIKPWG